MYFFVIDCEFDLKICPHLSPARGWHNEVGCDAVVPQVVVPGRSVAGLDLVLAAQVVEGGLGHVNSSATPANYIKFSTRQIVSRPSSGKHVIYIINASAFN